MVVTSGLGYRFILWMLRRLPNSQFWHNIGLFVTGSIITPIIPTANGRIAIVARVCRRYGGKSSTIVGAAATRFGDLDHVSVELACFLRSSSPVSR